MGLRSSKHIAHIVLTNGDTLAPTIARSHLSPLGSARRLYDSVAPRGREEMPWSNFYEIFGGKKKRERH